MKCHEIDYEIIGDDMQLVEIELDPGETVIAEAGAMNYLQPEITFETKMGDGSKPETGFLDKMFSEIPDLALRTTLMTGFPGETEEDRSNEVVRRFIVVETFSNIALLQTRRHLNLLSFDQIGWVWKVSLI